MTYKFCVFILLSLFSLSGCSLSPTNLKIAEQKLETAPDSTLLLLQKIQPISSLSKVDRALYGILLFQALDLTNQTLPPDSIINFSVNYYQTKNDNRELAIAYYYKARLYNKAQRFDEASVYYLKSLDIIQNSNEYNFLGKIYSDLGDICTVQKDFEQALSKFNTSFNYFQKAGDSVELCNKLIDIGRVYKFQNKTNKALQFYKKALSLTNDSLIHGAAFQEIGINYFYEKKMTQPNTS